MIGEMIFREGKRFPLDGDCCTNWKDAFFEVFGFVGSFIEHCPECERIYDYMKHVRDDVLSFDEFKEM